MTASDDHKRIYQAIFENPPRADISWEQVLDLLRTCGVRLIENGGEDGQWIRVWCETRRANAILHRLEDQPCLSLLMVKAVRRFLITSGVQPPRNPNE
ncbi:MAG: hypothetical protein Fur0046_35940 [Cyanobacteria bacterium J069]|nr:MAG: hypothetical protein D6742_05685 [Cyanobacteria bacterium J069]